MRVNSLLCYKGRTGATVTMTIASPCVLSLTAHGLLNGTAIVFTTTGALPTGVTAGTTYYARTTGVTTPLNNAHLYDTYDHAIDTANTTGGVNTSGTQSGTHTVWSSYWHNLSSGDRTRYGTSGSERVFSQMRDWVAGRSSAISVDDEYLEISDAFSDVNTAFGDCWITYAKIPAYKVFIETKVNGVRTPAFHGGHINRGYHLNTSGSVSYTFFPSRSKMYVNGFRITNYSAGEQNAFYENSVLNNSEIANMIFSCPTGRAINSGGGSANNFHDIIVHSSLHGLYLTSTSFSNSRVYNVTSVKNTNGVSFTDSFTFSFGSFFNIVSYGNTRNWPTATISVNGEGGAKNNAGKSGDVIFGTSSIATVTDASFVDLTNNDFRISSSSVLRDTGLTIPDGVNADILDNYRPNYSAGEETADNWDIGAFEYDSGNGEAPATVTLAVAGLVSGSQIRISKVSDNSEIYNATTGTSVSQSYTYTGDIEVKITVRKAGYQEWIGLATITSTGMNVTAGQSLDTTS